MDFIVSKSFSNIFFLLMPFDTRHYLKSNLSLLMHKKVLLTKNHVILFNSRVNNKKQLSLMGLFLCLSHILLEKFC